MTLVGQFLIKARWRDAPLVLRILDEAFKQLRQHLCIFEHIPYRQKWLREGKVASFNSCEN